MALKKTLIVAALGNLSVPDAYVSIAQVSIRKAYESGQPEWQVQADFNVHTTRDAKLSRAQSIVPVYLQTVLPSPPPNNVIAWLYNQLKLQPEFSDAVDVLE